MDDKIISAIQEYKNKQKKYNSKLKESLKKEVLETPPPKNKNSKKKQEIEELRKELDLLNDLDNFDHLPIDPITDQDSPSYEEYDEYLILKKPSKSSNTPELVDINDSEESDLPEQLSSQPQDISLNEDRFLNDLDDLSHSVPIDVISVDIIQENITSINDSEIQDIVIEPSKNIVENDPFDDLDNLADSLAPQISIQETTQESLLNIEHIQPLRKIEDLSEYFEPEVSIQETIQNPPLNEENIDLSNEINELTDSLEHEVSIQETIQNPPLNEENIDLSNEINELTDSLEHKVSIREIIQNSPLNEENIDLSNYTNELTDSLEQEISIQETIPQPSEILVESDPFDDLDSLSQDLPPEISQEQSFVVKSSTENNSLNELPKTEAQELVVESDAFDDLDSLSQDLLPESTQEQPVYVMESSVDDDPFNDLDELANDIQSEVLQEPIEDNNSINLTSENIPKTDHIEQTIEFLDQLAEAIESPLNSNNLEALNEFDEMQKNLKLLDEISQDKDLREQIYQRNDLKKNLNNSTDNEKPISLYLEESNTENSVLEADLHFSLEAELNTLNETFPVNNKEAEPPKFIIQEPKLKKPEKSTVLSDIEEVPPFQNEAKDYIKLDKNIPISDNPPVWTPDDQLLKTLELNRENRIIKTETEKIFSAVAFFNPKLFKSYLYPEIQLDNSLSIANFFVNNSNDFFDFHFITVQLSFLIDMKFILHQMIHYTNEKYKNDQTESTRMQISKLNSYEFKIHKFIHKLAIPASKENVPSDIKSLLKNRHSLEVKLLNKQEFLFFLDQKIQFFE